MTTGGSVESESDKEFSVHDQPDFERVYDDDEAIEVRRGDLRALLDLATGSMDFGSGFWDEEQVEIARRIAAVLGVDPVLVTPFNFTCKYSGEHNWTEIAPENQVKWNGATRYCSLCRHTDLERPQSECGTVESSKPLQSPNPTPQLDRP